MLLAFGFRQSSYHVRNLPLRAYCANAELTARDGPALELISSLSVFSSALASRSLFSLSFSFARTVRVFLAVPIRGVRDGVFSMLTNEDLRKEVSISIFGRLYMAFTLLLTPLELRFSFHPSRQPRSHLPYNHAAIHTLSSVLDRPAEKEQSRPPALSNSAASRSRLTLLLSIGTCCRENIVVLIQCERDQSSIMGGRCRVVDLMGRHVS